MKLQATWRSEYASEIPGPVCFKFKILVNLISGHTQYISAEGVLGRGVCCIDTKATGHAGTTAVTDRHGILCQVAVNGLAKNL